MVDDAELSVDVVESVLPERVAGAFFTDDAVAGAAAAVVAAVAVADAALALAAFIDC